MNIVDAQGANQTEGHIGKSEQSYYYPEHLPPTHITEKALNLLRYDFGVPDHFIDGLRTLTSSFRYDRCVDRCNRIAQNTSYYFQNGDNSELIVIPNAEELDESLDGQCGNLAIKWLKLAHITGWIDDVNAYLQQQKKRIVHLLHVNGYAKTHFVTGEANHVWTGLSQNASILVPQWTILVDPSFQMISTDDESAYKMKFDKHTIDPKSFEMQTTRTVEIGVYNPNQKQHSGNSIVVGISADRASSLGFGFSHMGNTNLKTIVDVSPFVGIVDEKERSSFATLKDGKIVIDIHTDFSQATADEATDMLNAITKMNIVQDNRLAWNAIDQKKIISW